MFHFVTKTAGGQAVTLDCVTKTAGGLAVALDCVTEKVAVCNETGCDSLDSLQFQVDRTKDSVTAIQFIGDKACFYRVAL